jgi:AcrR family transcriptional regulator
LAVKKGLFLAVLAELGEQFLVALQACISRRAENDIRDALEHVITDYSATIKSDPEIQRVLFQAVVESGDPDIAYCVSKHNRRVYGFIRQLIEQACEEGDLAPTTNLDAAAWGYMSIILALQYGLMLDLSGAIAQIQEETSRIWLRGLLSSGN